MGEGTPGYDIPEQEQTITFKLSQLDGQRLLHMLELAIPAIAQQQELGYEAMREMMDLHDQIEKQLPEGA